MTTCRVLARQNEDDESGCQGMPRARPPACRVAPPPACRRSSGRSRRAAGTARTAARCLFAALAAAAAVQGAARPSALAAWAVQDEEPPVGAVTGLVYDSTASAPLAGARVALMGTLAVGESGEDGRFRLEDVPAGEYQIAFFHPRLGVLGINGSPRRVAVEAGRTADAYLAVPSRETIVGAWCSAEPGGGPVSLGGVVTDALTGVPLPRAVVKVHGERQGALRARPVLAEARTESNGEYLLCNLPADPAAIVQVEFGPTRNLPVPLPQRGPRALDLEITISTPVTMTGSVLDYATRSPLAGARVRLLGTEFATLTDSAGRFGFTSIPPGRQTIETGQLGYATRVDSLTVFSDEALGLEIVLSTEAIALDPIVVTGRRNEHVFTTTGVRFVGLTEVQVDSIAHRVTDFAGLVRQVRLPGIVIRETYMRNAFGQPQMGTCIEMTRGRGRTNPNTCNMVEVRINDGIVPEPAFFLAELSPGDIRRVQFIAPIDATLLYGERAANGVLLIYTR